MFAKWFGLAELRSKVISLDQECAALRDACDEARGEQARLFEHLGEQAARIDELEKSLVEGTRDRESIHDAHAAMREDLAAHLRWLNDLEGRAGHARDQLNEQDDRTRLLGDVIEDIKLSIIRIDHRLDQTARQMQDATIALYERLEHPSSGP